MLKKLGFLLGFALILLGLFLTTVLLPPHLQIRKIEPTLPDQAELNRLLEQSNGPTKLSYFVSSEQKGQQSSLAHTTFVVEWGDGKLFLVDLGMDEANAIEFGELFEMLRGADPAVVHGTAASILGDDVNRVNGVGFTHLHVDHVQGIETICATQINQVLVLQTPDQRTKQNIHTAEQAELLKNSDCVRQLEVSNAQSVSDYFPGLGIYPLGGHTPGSTLFAVAIQDKLWLLSGDTTNSKSKLLNNQGKGWVYSYLMVPEHVDRTAELRVWLAELDQQENVTVLVSHDLQSIQDTGLQKW